MQRQKPWFSDVLRAVHTFYFCHLFKDNLWYHSFYWRRKTADLFPSVTPLTHFTTFFCLACVTFHTSLGDYSSYHNACWSSPAFCVCWWISLLVWNIWMKWPLIWLALAVFFFFLYFSPPHLSCCSDCRDAQTTTSYLERRTRLRWLATVCFLLCFMQYNKRLLTK